MPTSQLKQLKASLRDNGILGPQKPKKQRKANHKDAQRRMQQSAALERIRERFNPFEAKAPAKRDKFDISSNKPTKKTIERPGVTRGLGEERRRETLLKEMQSRNKVGGILDRRFGEDDPDMTPEQKAAERFAQQALRTSRKNDMFNLEDDSEEELQLTHGGRALDLDGAIDSRMHDDFDEDVSGSEVDDFEAQDDRPRKRVRLQDGSDEQNEQGMLDRKKTKAEVMQEVIAKSKAYKAARQAQKEGDDELRAELDQGLGDVFAELVKHGTNPKSQLPSPPITDSEPTMDPARAAMLAGKTREEAEKEYEANIRQMKMDARSKPSMRTKTEEEKAAEEKARLEELERKRIRRMKGEADSSEEDSAAEGAHVVHGEEEKEEEEEEADDAGAFGLEQPAPRYTPNLAVEDEDEFVMDDLVASDSDAGLASDFEEDGGSTLQEPEDDGDDDFINGLVLPKQPQAEKAQAALTAIPSKSLPFTFSCPQSLDDLLNETSNVTATDLPTAVQRIRALYHKGLAEENEEKLGKFAKALVPWIAALVKGECPQNPSMPIIEQLLRHLHSMAKAQPLQVAVGCRDYLRQFLAEDRISLDAGDLIVLTGISTIFPTSDQWHSVVTPAMLVLARYLGQALMDGPHELAKDNYNPERKQRDPDAERAELSKLKAEHKKERKGAMRELRKDANFMAREQLREKKARDEAYEKKFRKLVAEIQSEEGREANVYEQEKAKRKGRV